MYQEMIHAVSQTILHRPCKRFGQIVRPAFLLIWLTGFFLVGSQTGLADTGGLDSTFDQTGYLTVKLGNGWEAIRDVAIQADGKIVTAGWANSGSNDDFAVARFNPDGSLDPTFAEDGYLTVNFGAYDYGYGLAIQADGKIVVVGYTDNGPDHDIAIVRLNRDGSFDTTFHEDGLTTVDFGSHDYGYDVAVQADGKIVVAGSARVNDHDDFAAIRFNSDGSLDPTFADGGTVTSNAGSPNGNDQAWGLALQDDGKIVLAGRADTGHSYDFAAVRYNSDGSLDPTFADDGRVTVDFGADDYGYDLAIQPDGQIVLVGSAGVGRSNDFAMVRLNSDGSFDPTFADDGQVTTSAGPNSDAQAWSLAIRDDGKIVLAGHIYNGHDDDFATLRYHSDGRLDTAFAAGGIALTDFDGYDYGYAIALQADGKTIIAGAGLNDTAVTRLNPDGSPDIAFAEAGLSRVDLTSGESTIRAMAVQADGKIVAAGWAYNGRDDDLAVARFNSDGSLDTAFGDGGSVITGFAEHDYGYGLAIQTDGKIVLTGYQYTGRQDELILIRLNPDGSFDPTFATAGLARANFTSASYGYDVAIQPDGKIVVAGSVYNDSGYDFAAVRFNRDGSLDTTFGQNGQMTAHTGQAGYNDQAWRLTIQPDGKIILVGSADNDQNYDFAVVRLKHNGSLDPTFGDDGRVTVNFGSHDYGHAVAVQPDGKIVLVGSSLAGGNYHFAVARLTYDGRPDPAFNGDGKSITHTGHPHCNGQAWDLAIQPDGKIVLTGFSQIGPYSGFAVARYHSDGSLDPAFNPAAVITGHFAGSGYGYATAIQPDGKILTGGTGMNTFALVRQD